MITCDDIKLKGIYESNILNPQQKTFETLFDENHFIFSGDTSSGLLYHATRIQAVYSILHGGGFTTNSHGVTNENSTISTSINHNITQYFSSDKHKCVFVFDFNKSPFPVFILPAWLHSMHSDSGIEFDIEPEEAEKKAKEYNIKIDQFGEISSDFLMNNLDATKTAFVQQYVFDQYISIGREPPLSDESEITFFQDGTKMLFDAIQYIVIDGQEFDNAKSCLEYLKDNYEQDYLNKIIER